MSALVYLGNKSSDVKAIAVKKTVDNAKAQGLTQAQIDARISTLLANYPTRQYADDQDALRATAEYVNTQDALRIKLTEKNVANGIVALNSSGDVDLARIPTSYRTQQRGHRAYYSPSAYMGQNFTSASTSETTLYTCPIADPGMAYRIMAWAYFECLGGATGYPAIVVRVGSTSGPIVARGFGPWRADYGTLNVVPDNTSSQASRTGATTLYVRGYKAGSGSEAVIYGSFLNNMCVMLTPA